MVKTVVKKEGATQTCGRCTTEIICRLKDYGGNFAPTLQWQNYDETPHFKTTDGKIYSCNIPEDDEQGQTRIPNNTPPARTADDTPGTVSRPEFLIIAHLEEKIDILSLNIQNIEEKVDGIFRCIVQGQLGKN